MQEKLGGQPSFEQLQGRQERLSHIVEQRQVIVVKLDQDLGGVEVPENLQQARQLGVRNRVIESIQKLRSLSDQTQQKIDEFLPILAESHLSKLRRKERDLMQVKTAASRGYLNLPEGTVNRYQQEIQELRDKPLTDPLLARAMKLHQRKQPEQPPVEPAKPAEEEVLPQILFDETAKTLQINDGPIIKLGKIEAALVGFLYNHPYQEFLSRELKQIIEEAGSQAKNVNIIGAVIFALERRLDRKIFKRTGQTNAVKWSLPRVMPQPEEKKEREIFSEKELAILAALIYLRHNTTVVLETGSFLFEIDDSIRSACQNLVNRILAVDLDNLSTQKENYTRYRSAVLEKLGRVLKSEASIDTQTNTDAEVLLIWLYCFNQDQMLGLMTQFLNQTPEQIWQLEGNEVKKIWREWQANSSPAARPEAAAATRVRVNRTERADSDVRQKIDGYLDQIDTKLAEHELSLPASQPQVTRAFPILTDTVFNQLRTKKYLKPEVGRDGNHPAYTKEEISLALYIHNRSRESGFNGKIIKDLKKIITEIARERTLANRQNQNGH